jgi:putative hemolysin
MFPAGEVSTYKDGKLMVDKPWEEGAIKVIRKAQVPVVPIYFMQKNSRLFYLLSKISGTFRTAKLLRSLARKTRDQSAYWQTHLC